MRVLALIPAHNEAESLPGLLQRLREVAPEVDACVIDDGSTDGTAAAARQHGAILLQLPFNLGIGGAMQAGYLYARAHGYAAAVQVDGDGQHDPAQVPVLLAPIRDGRADLVVGSRFLDGVGYQSTALRRAGIRLLSRLLRLRCRAQVTDATSGFRAAGSAAIALFAATYPHDYPEPEAVALAHRSGLRVVEVPVRMSARAHGASTITRARSVYYLLKVSLALLLVPARSPSPLPEPEDRS